MVEGARLEIVYTAKPYRGFESLSPPIEAGEVRQNPENPYGLTPCGFFVARTSGKTGCSRATWGNIGGNHSDREDSCPMPLTDNTIRNAKPQ